MARIPVTIVVHGDRRTKHRRSIVRHAQIKDIHRLTTRSWTASRNAAWSGRSACFVQIANPSAL